MIQTKKVLQLLKNLSFTNKELAESVGVSESMIKKIRMGRNMGSEKVQRKIVFFVKNKLEKINQLLSNFDFNN